MVLLEVAGNIAFTVSSISVLQMCLVVFVKIDLFGCCGVTFLFLPFVL